VQLAARQGIQLVFGAPNEAIFEGYLKRLSWAQPAFIRTYIRPLAVGRAGLIGQLGRSAFRALPASGLRAVEIETQRPDSDALDAFLGEQKAARGRWRVHRTRAWYDFRYQPAGKFDYRWCALRRDGRLVGFSVWGLSLDKGRGLRANLADVVGEDEAACRLAVAAAIRSARGAGADYLVAALTLPVRAEMLLRNGFVPYRRAPLIARTLDADKFSANPFRPDAWDLFGADFDFF
jgi:hypothetical protein